MGFFYAFLGANCLLEFLELLFIPVRLLLLLELLRELKNSVYAKVAFFCVFFVIFGFLGVTLIGVAPENQIKYPKVNPTEREDTELASGHTHFFLLGGETVKYQWGDESIFKIQLAAK